MTDFLKNLNIGILHVMGLWLPGILSIGLFLVLVAPPIIFLFSAIVIHSNGPWDITNVYYHILVFYERFYSAIFFIIIIFAYLNGYLLRLYTPDILDKKSAEKILKDMFREWLIINNKSTTELRVKKYGDKHDVSYPGLFIRWIMRTINDFTIVKRIKGVSRLKNFSSYESINSEIIKMANDDGWIFGLPDQDGDKYPYLNFQKYLEKRGHKDIAKLVIWDSISPFKKKNGKNNRQKNIQRSKIIINTYKQEIRNSDPDKARFIESMEAHIRLLSGTWAVSKIYSKLALTTIFAFGILYYISSIDSFCGLNTIRNIVYNQNIYISIFLLELLFLYILWRIKVWIEKEFHYQRLRELTRILTYAYEVPSKFHILKRIKRKTLFLP